jgi:hypothetical protein
MVTLTVRKRNAMINSSFNYTMFETSSIVDHGFIKKKREFKSDVSGSTFTTTEDNTKDISTSLLEVWLQLDPAESTLIYTQ